MVLDLGLSLTGTAILNQGGGEFDPLDLSPAAFYEVFDINTLFTNYNGTVPVLNETDPIKYIADKSGNNRFARTGADAKRPLYQTVPNRAVFDLIDDNLSTDFSGVGPFEATLIQASAEGVVHAKVNIPDGVWNFSILAQYIPSDNILGMMIVESDITAGQAAQIKKYFKSNGSSGNFAGVTNMKNWFRGRTDVTELLLNDWDTSLVGDASVLAFGAVNLVRLEVGDWNTSSFTDVSSFVRTCFKLKYMDVSKWDVSNIWDFELFAYRCLKLPILDVSNWNTQSATNMNSFAFDCASLTELDVSNWNTSNVTLFSSFARGCPLINVLDVSSWDTSSVLRFDRFITSNSGLTSLDVSNWDTSSCFDFILFANGCSNLSDITTEGGTGNPFADSPCTNYTDAFTDTNLTQASIDNILVRINAAGTGNGVFEQSGGSAPSATGEAAITALRARGWTITVTGGF